jgi:hypothetical protein
MNRFACITLAAAVTLAISGCKRAEEAMAPITGSTAPVKPVTQPVTVNVASSVPTCNDETNGGGTFKPMTRADNLGFGWTPVTKPSAATAYAAELGRYQPGSTAPAILAARTFKPDEELLVMAGERVMGNNYRARVVAYDDKGPICVVGGINGLSPLPG